MRDEQVWRIYLFARCHAILVSLFHVAWTANDGKTMGFPGRTWDPSLLTLSSK